MRANEIGPGLPGFAAPEISGVVTRTPTQSQEIAAIDAGTKPFHEKARRCQGGYKANGPFKYIVTPA